MKNTPWIVSLTAMTLIICSSLTDSRATPSASANSIPVPETTAAPPQQTAAEPTTVETYVIAKVEKTAHIREYLLHGVTREITDDSDPTYLVVFKIDAIPDPVACTISKEQFDAITVGKSRVILTYRTNPGKPQNMTVDRLDVEVQKS